MIVLAFTRDLPASVFRGRMRGFAGAAIVSIQHLFNGISQVDNTLLLHCVLQYLVCSVVDIVRYLFTVLYIDHRPCTSLVLIIWHLA